MKINHRYKNLTRNNFLGLKMFLKGILPICLMSEHFEFLFLFQQLLTILVQNSITFISLLLTFLLMSITQKNQ